MSGQEVAQAGVSVVFLLVLLVFGLIFYLLPTIIAVARGVNNLGALIVINVLFGWSLVGWGIALAWSFMDTPQRRTGYAVGGYAGKPVRKQKRGYRPPPPNFDFQDQ